jgi:hypothetical protein
VVAMPVIEKVTRAGQPVHVTESDIARRAFEIYCERGCQHGHDLNDWLQAERELRGAVNIAVA